MIFQSYEYLGLLLSVLIVYWTLPRAAQNALLLVASYTFYAFVHPWLAIILFAYTVVNYFAAIQIRSHPEHSRKILLVSIASGLVVLGVFKYLGFFVENVTGLLAEVGFSSNTVFLNIFLPAGISFYTFQTLAYVIDVQKNRFEPRRNFVDVALFVSFFPQLVAGPIERASHLLPQFERRRKFDPTVARSAIYLLIWGFFKKLVIADNVAVIADKTFQLQDPGVPLLIVGVLAFGIQILADFSGYTDIARGSARLLGIRLSHNFDSPYISGSPSEFWRRWHMSLSSWFRDYVYIPLGGSRAGRWGNVATLLATFLLVGLWHGAAWNFVLWGGYHGLLIQGHRSLVSRVSMPRHVARYGGIAITFVLIHIGWFLFRADDLSIVRDAFSAQADGRAVGGGDVTAFLFFQVVIYAMLLSAPVMRRWLTPTGGSLFKLNRLDPAVFNTAAATAMFFGILTLRSQISIDFIYFQF